MLADAHLVDGRVSLAESSFAFTLGFALQLVDDLQGTTCLKPLEFDLTTHLDTEEDLADNQHTLFTVAYQRSGHGSKRSLPFQRRHGVGDKDARRLSTFLEHVVMSAYKPSLDNQLRELMLKMTWNSVLKAVARTPALFSSDFKSEWTSLGPLPKSDMKNLHSMATLFKLAAADLI